MNDTEQKHSLHNTLTAAHLKLVTAACLALTFSLLGQGRAVGAYLSDQTPSTGSRKITAQGIAAQPGYTIEQIQELPQLANIQISVKGVRVVAPPPNVTVLAQAQAKEQDSELKIDAMFIAKAVIEGTNGQTQQVKVVFSEDSGDGRYINISKKVITDFSSGKFHPDQLLNALVLLNVHHEEAPNVAQGPEYERRLVVWERIQKLKEKGAGVHQFELEFKQIEGLAKANNQQAMLENLDTLESRLQILEENARQATNSAHGHGIQGTVTHSSGAATGRPSFLPDLSKLPLSPEGGDFPLPPDPDRLKALFMEKSNTWVGMISSRNSQQGEKARQLKTQIEQCFGSGKLGQGFHALHELQQMVQQVTGKDPFMPEGGPGMGPPPGRDGNGGPQGGPGGPGFGQGPGGQGGPGFGQGPGGAGFQGPESRGLNDEPDAPRTGQAPRDPRLAHGPAPGGFSEAPVSVGAVPWQAGAAFGDPDRGFGEGDGRGFGEGDGRGFGEGDSRGFGEGDGRGFGEGQGFMPFGEGDGRGFGDGDGRGFGEGDGKGFGDGDGRGFAEGFGQGDGSGFGAGNGMAFSDRPAGTPSVHPQAGQPSVNGQEGATSREEQATRGSGQNP